jgi:hypothetical protein
MILHTLLKNNLMNLKNIFSILLVTLLLSCESNEPVINADNLLLGSWVEPSFDSGTTTYKRGNSLPDENYGISFTQKGEFIERSSGWCGTPPLTYFDYKGSFETDETLIKITTTSFPYSYQWRIISLTENELIVKRELTEQENDHRDLITLFDEIQNLADSTSCDDSANWTFTAYGSKACGGSQGYIPYSTKINTVAFLQKVAAYTQAEKDFNYKWGVVSDCSLPNVPTSVVCENGYPILKY